MRERERRHHAPRRTNESPSITVAQDDSETGSSLACFHAAVAEISDQQRSRFEQHDMGLTIRMAGLHSIF